MITHWALIANKYLRKHHLMTEKQPTSYGIEQKLRWRPQYPLRSLSHWQTKRSLTKHPSPHSTFIRALTATSVLHPMLPVARWSWRLKTFRFNRRSAWGIYQGASQIELRNYKCLISEHYRRIDYHWFHDQMFPSTTRILYSLSSVVNYTGYRYQTDTMTSRWHSLNINWLTQIP